MCQHPWPAPDHHNQQVINPAGALEMAMVDKGALISLTTLSIGRRAGYKTRMKVRGEKKRKHPYEKTPREITSYSLQQDLAYFHMPLKSDEEH